MPNVLLVEADSPMSQLLRAVLDVGELGSQQATTVDQALHRLREQGIDAILINVSLVFPEVIAEIRNLSNIPMIVWGQPSDEARIASVLARGVDDFIVTPFVPDELLARVRIAMMRYGLLSTQPTKINSQVSTLDQVYSSIKPFSNEGVLLNILYSRQGELVTTEEILLTIWGSFNQSTNNLRVLVTCLRNKLREEGSPYEIVNEHGRGYRLISAD